MTHANASQQLVLDYLSENRQEFWKPPDDIGLFVAAEIPATNWGLSEYNSFQSQREIRTATLLSDDDSSEEQACVTEERITEELKSTLKHVVWESPNQKHIGVWFIQLPCPTNILNLVKGQNRSFFNELEASCPRLKIETSKHVHREKPQQTSRTHVHLSKGCTWIQARLDGEQIELARIWLELKKKIHENMKHAPYTHFVSLPILASCNDHIIQKYTEFKYMIIRDFPNIDPDLLMPRGQLHFTLIMLRLYTKEQLENAIASIERLKTGSNRILFQDTQPDSIPNDITKLEPGLHMELKGLFVMEEDVKAARVIYTKENEELKEDGHPWIRLRRPATTYLDSLMEEMISNFLEDGVVEMEDVIDDRVIDASGIVQRKWHVTLLNAKLGRNNNATFDAGELVEKLKNFDFGRAILSGLHISARGTAAVDTEYYRAEHIMTLRPHMGL